MFRNLKLKLCRSLPARQTRGDVQSACANLVVITTFEWKNTANSDFRLTVS